MKKFLQILKEALKSLLIWIGMTIIAIIIDSFLGLSEKSNGFTFLLILIPLIVAIWSPCKKLIKWSYSISTKPQKHKENPVISPPHVLTQTTTSPPKQIPRSVAMSRVDKMDGHDFERFTAELLKRLGYERVEVTPGSGDQGVDVIAVKDGKKYAIQCKRYGQKLGNKPVQEVHAGKTIYGCSVAVVLTNNYFTEGGKEAARALGVELWDRDKLERMLTYAAHMAARSTS